MLGNSEISIPSRGEHNSKFDVGVDVGRVAVNVMVGFDVSVGFGLAVGESVKIGGGWDGEIKGVPMIFGDVEQP